MNEKKSERQRKTETATEQEQERRRGRSEKESFGLICCSLLHGGAKKRLHTNKHHLTEAFVQSLCLHILTVWIQARVRDSKSEVAGEM